MSVYPTNGGWYVELDGLEDKWRLDSPDYPPCALCGEQIGSEEEDEREGDEEGEVTVPVRLWRSMPEQPTQEMTFHFKCLSDSGRVRT